MAGRKHLMRFSCLVTIDVEDLDGLRDFIARRRNPTMLVSPQGTDINGDPLPAGKELVYIEYGPVRGANQLDVTKMLDLIDMPYVLHGERNDTEYLCECERHAGSCTDDTESRSLIA